MLCDHEGKLPVRDQSALRPIHLTADLLRDAVYGVVRREGCPFLPAHEMREIVSGEIGLALRFV